MLYVVTPDGMKAWIDSRVEQGVKAFVVSDEKHGNAFAPSIKVPLYRIPCSIHKDAFGSINLSRAVNMSRIVIPIIDLDWLSEQSKEIHERNLKKEDTP